MENIITHEKLENGKTLLLALHCVRILYDQRECQCVNKPMKKTMISKSEKEIIALEISKTSSFPFVKNFESDKLESYLYYDKEECRGITIIISKEKSFAYVQYLKPIWLKKDMLEDEKLIIEALEEKLQYEMKAYKEKIPYITIETSDGNNNIFFCHYCKQKFNFKCDIEKPIYLECKCGAEYEIKTAKVENTQILKAHIREI